MLPTYAPYLPPSRFCLHWLDDVGVWISWSIWHICLLDVVKGSSSEHRPLYLVVTLLLGEMLDVAKDGPHQGKLQH